MWGPGCHLAIGAGSFYSDLGFSLESPLKDQMSVLLCMQLDVMLDSPETRAEYEGVTEDMQLKIGFLQAVSSLACSCFLCGASIVSTDQSMLKAHA